MSEHGEPGRRYLPLACCPQGPAARLSGPGAANQDES